MFHQHEWQRTWKHECEIIWKVLCGRRPAATTPTTLWHHLHHGTMGPSWESITAVRAPCPRLHCRKTSNLHSTTEEIWPAPSTVLVSCQSSNWIRAANYGLLAVCYSRSSSPVNNFKCMQIANANQGDACSGAGLAIERTSHPPRTPVAQFQEKVRVQNWLLRQKSSEDVSMLQIRSSKAVTS